MAESLKHKFLSGTSWTAAEHIILTVLGIAQLSITSRLLTPVDFGIYAIATFFAGLGKVVFSMGLSAALIQKKGNILPYLDTAWSAGVLVALVISVIIMILIPPLCIFYYNSMEAVWPSIVIMISCLFISACNPGIIIYNKEILLDKIFYLDVFSKLFSFVLVIICVYFTHSYWGLIIALLSESIFRFVYSFIIHPYRPKFTINKVYFKEMYNFSGWIQLKNIVSWLSSNIDTAIVGNVLGAVRLGFYNRAQSISQYAPTFVNAVVDTVAFPLYSSINDDKERINKVMISVQNFMIFLMSIIALLFVRYSDKIVLIVLGDQWASMSNVFAILAIAYLFQALLLSFTPVLRSFGYTKQEFIFYLIKISLMIAILYPLVKKWDVIGAAWAILFSVLLTFPIMIYIIRKKTKLHLLHLYISIIISSFSVAIVNFIINIVNVYYLFDEFWLLELFSSVVVLCIVFLGVYLCTKEGPGEIILYFYSLIKNKRK